jgi:hypothetical protein
MEDNKPRTTMMVWRVIGGVLPIVEAPRPTMQPRDCKMIDEDLECLGCGVKVGCVEPGHCYAMEGKSAYKAAALPTTTTGNTMSD